MPPISDQRTIKWDNVLSTSPPEPEHERVTIPVRSVSTGTPTPSTYPTTRPPNAHSLSSYSSIKPTGATIPTTVNYGRPLPPNQAQNSVSIPSLWRPSTTPLPTSEFKPAALPPYRPPISYAPFSTNPPSSSRTPSAMPVASAHGSAPLSALGSNPVYGQGWQGAKAWVMATLPSTPVPEITKPRRTTSSIGISSTSPSSFNQITAEGTKPPTPYVPESIFTQESPD